MQKLVVIILIFVLTNLAEGDEHGDEQNSSTKRFSRPTVRGAKLKCYYYCRDLKNKIYNFALAPAFMSKCENEVSDLLV